MDNPEEENNAADGGTTNEDGEAEGFVGDRISRLSEMAQTIQNELKKIKSEENLKMEKSTSNVSVNLSVSSDGNTEDAEGVRGSSSPSIQGPVMVSAPSPSFGTVGRNIVTLNVGGTRFTTTLTTLTKNPHSMLGAMFSGRFALTTDEKNRYFIDRDGKHFGTILNYLRDGFVALPESETSRKELLIEAQYYQLSGLIDMLTPEEKVQCPVWRWSPGSKSAYITLVNDFRTARAGEGKNWNTVLADTGFVSGRHYFELEVTKYNNSGGGWGISFGLVDVLHDFEYNHFGHRDNLPKGTRRTWSYVAATGKVYERGVEMYAGRPFSVNDRIGLLLDWKHHIVQFYSNGEPEGPGVPFSWSNDDPPLFPAMSLNGGGDKFHVTIVANPKIPQNLLRKTKEKDPN